MAKKTKNQLYKEKAKKAAVNVARANGIEPVVDNKKIKKSAKELLRGFWKDTSSKTHLK